MRNGFYSVVYTDSVGENSHNAAPYIINIILLTALIGAIKLLIKVMTGGGRNA